MKLTSDDIKEISKIKNEPAWMLEHRLEAFAFYKKAKEPNFGPKLNIDYDSINYYKKREEDLTNDWNKIGRAHV